MRLHERVEWDNAKAELNVLNHGVTFDDAAAVLQRDDGDLYLLEFYDDEHSGREDRYYTFGSDPQKPGVVLRISWTPREDAEGQLTRLISARHATAQQRYEYAEEIKKRMGD